MSVRILLADDHALLRQGVRRILESQPDLSVVAETASGIEAVSLAARHQPDVAVVDVGMKGLNGIEATSQILTRSPRTAVLILSMHNDERYVQRALSAGARGYLLKDCVEDDLLRAIQEVRKGGRFFSPAIAPLAESARGPETAADGGDRYESLTARERHVHQLLAEGASNKDIANRLNLSLHTVETHRARIMEKLGVHSMAELVLSAVRRGLIS